jgi:predicted RNA binding protein YcfA (HicA-like mRNA interferase family)
LSKFEKLVKRLNKFPPDASYDEIKTVFEHKGCYRIRENGSHVFYRHPNKKNCIMFPKKGGRKVKKRYIYEILKYLDLLLIEEND